MWEYLFGNPAVQPDWAKKMEKRIMATIEQKMQELQDALAPIAAALEGISGDLQSQADMLTANAAEIEALKQAVLDAQGGNVSDADLARIDAVIASIKEAAAKAQELDGKLPNVPAAPTE